MKNKNKLILGGLIVFAATILAVWQGSVMRANTITFNTLNEEAANLRVVQDQLIARHQDIKKEVAQTRLDSAQDLALILPTEENITSLNRLFDDFQAQNDFAENPFFINSVNYQEASTSVEGEYRYVSFTMNVDSSKKNLLKFIDFVEQSGALDSGIRLMSIESMNINFPSQPTEPYSVNMTLNAYFTREING